MHCPFCKEEDTKVIDSRLGNNGRTVRRRRECPTCTGRFTTYEAIEMSFPRIVKRDGRRSNFDEAKLRDGFLKALEKRPVGDEQIEVAVTAIKNRLHACSEREVSASTLGHWVMDQLRDLDLVAYVRFASVYLSFDDPEAFVQEIRKLKLEETKKVVNKHETTVTE